VKSFMVNDVDIHKLNLRPFKNLKLLVENLIKKWVFSPYYIF
jgi:hypothetical protein